MGGPGALVSRVDLNLGGGAKNFRGRVAMNLNDAMNLHIAPTDTSFSKYRDHAKVLIVFKRWCNYLILCEIIFQLEILKD